MISPPMLPDPEISALLMTVDDAMGFAAEGQLADGCAVPVAGTGAQRRRGRAEEAKVAGKPWGDELVQRFQLAMENYVASYGVPLD